MKNIIIHDILNAIDDGIKTSTLNACVGDFITNSITRTTYGNMIINCNLDMRFSGDYGHISIYNKDNKYTELLKLKAKTHFIWLWTKKDSTEYLENRLYEILSDAKKFQKQKIEKMKEQELFDLLPVERKQQIKREQKLERITK